MNSLKSTNKLFKHFKLAKDGWEYSGVVGVQRCKIKCAIPAMFYKWKKIGLNGKYYSATPWWLCSRVYHYRQHTPRY
jgi:hypothetical protein